VKWFSGMSPSLECGLLRREFLFNIPHFGVPFLRNGEVFVRKPEHVLPRSTACSQGVPGAAVASSLLLPSVSYSVPIRVGEIVNYHSDSPD